MDIFYKKIFSTACQTAASLAEEVMDYNKNSQNDNGYHTAEVMKANYQMLKDNIDNDKELEYKDYVNLIAIIYIIMNNIQNQIDNKEKALQEYKINILPKLSRIMEEAKEDKSKVKELAENLFKISET